MRFDNDISLQNQRYLSAYLTDGTVQRLIGLDSSNNVVVSTLNSATITTLSSTTATIATANVTTLTTNVAAAMISAAGTTLSLLGSNTNIGLTVTPKGTGGLTLTTGDLTATTGNVICSAAGKGLQIKTGSNARAGKDVLVSGTVTVSNTSVTANTLIYVSRGAKNASTAMGDLYISAVTPNTSFVITSVVDLTLATQTGDLSDVYWVLIEPSP